MAVAPIAPTTENTDTIKMTHKNEMINRTEGCIVYYTDLYKKDPMEDIIKTLKALNENLLELKAPVAKKKAKNENKFKT